MQPDMLRATVRCVTGRTQARELDHFFAVCSSHVCRHRSAENWRVALTTAVQTKFQTSVECRPLFMHIKFHLFHVLLVTMMDRWKVYGSL